MQVNRDQVNQKVHLELTYSEFLIFYDLATTDLYGWETMNLLNQVNEDVETVNKLFATAVDDVNTKYGPALKGLANL